MNPTRATAFGLFLLDVLASLVVFNVIRSLYFGLLEQPHDHWLVVPLLAPIALIIFAIYLIEGYKARTDMISVDYTSQHSIALMGAMLSTLLLAYAFWGEGSELQASRFVIAVSFIALIPLTLGYRRLIYHSIARSRGEHILIFLGDYLSCATFREEVQKMGTAQRVVYSVVSEESVAPFATPGGEKLRPFQEVLNEVQDKNIGVEAIILRESARELSAEISRRLVQLYFSGVPTYTLELFHQVYWQKIPLYRLNQTWLFQEGFQIAREPVFERLKRVSDITLSLVGLTISAPFILFGMVAVWLEDRGPPFFFQSRVGKNHVPFRLVKLRSMRVEQKPGTGNMYTQKGDARITRIGKFLRASRLDELPQLWNVLQGDMSLIGPRAEWDKLVENYERDIPCYHFRHLVKPGITGWAQVNYPYGANMEDTLRKLEYDLYYIRHFSFLLDATIVLKTIHIMLFGKGR